LNLGGTNKIIIVQLCPISITGCFSPLRYYSIPINFILFWREKVLCID